MRWTTYPGRLSVEFSSRRLQVRTNILAVIKIMFLSKNLNQNMPKMSYFFKKIVKNYQALRALPLDPC